MLKALAPFVLRLAAERIIARWSEQSVQPPSPTGERVSQLGTLFYFGFFLLMPWWSRLGEFKPVPERITYAAH